MKVGRTYQRSHLHPCKHWGSSPKLAEISQTAQKGKKLHEEEDENQRGHLRRIGKAGQVIQWCMYDAENWKYENKI